ncbi:MAG: hypothetical protein ACK5RS_13800, partial [Acidobacteriota bacterium]
EHYLIVGAGHHLRLVRHTVKPAFFHRHLETGVKRSPCHRHTPDVVPSKRFGTKKYGSLSFH